MTASRIRKIRREKEMSGTNVAELIGISAQYYYDIEKGKRNLSAENATKLADIFGVSTDYLLGKIENPLPLSPEKNFVDSLNLDDEFLLDKYSLTLDGETLSKEEAKLAIAFLRTALKEKKGVE
ncbi:helix-turn-helix transcriptional regulator [Chengkuizengella sp. SCS-71B]|uniref:helix-turn-helix domain-containing protein n=1 Tax=Chengkuizengella sp. SCS-71B TaxID=3115290 RepID=UPI0032C21CF7